MVFVLEEKRTLSWQVKLMHNLFEKTDITGINPTLPQKCSSLADINEITFTPEKVNFALESLKEDSHPGPDQIQVMLLSKCYQTPL